MERILTRDIVVNKSACRLIMIAAGILLMGLGAFVRIPLGFTPVPFTLQTFFVLLCAALLGTRLSAAVQLGYASLGVAGLSVFTGSGFGWPYLAGPTGGYIIGFIAASYVISRILKNSPTAFGKVFLALLVGSVIILSFGTIWLKVLLGLSWDKAVLLGFLPFIPGDILKVWAASILAIRLRKRISQII